MTPEQRDARLQRVYGITLAEYDAQLAKQGGGCWACGSTPKTRALPVDHSHDFVRVKLTTYKQNHVWFAFTDYRGFNVSRSGASKNKAKQALRKALKRMSVRGILCFGCNRALRSIRNSAFIAERLCLYLKQAPIWM